MDISKATAGVLAALCVAAGAGIAYVAIGREGATADTEATSTVPPAAAVERSEVVLDEAAPAQPEPAPVPAVDAAPPSPRAASARTPRRAAAAQRSVEAAPPRSVDAPIAAPASSTPVVIESPPHVRPLDAVGPVYEDLVVAADSVIGLQMETTVTSEKARVEDAVVARVTRDVKVGDRVAIPAGARAEGEVTLVERGGRIRERARLGVRFTSIVLADGTRVPIQTETVVREGDSPANESAAKIGGGAIGGAIIGAIVGGAKGAAIGGSVGAGAGTAAVMAGGRNAATLPAGTPLTVRIQEPVTVTVEK